MYVSVMYVSGGAHTQAHSQKPGEGTKCPALAIFFPPLIQGFSLNCQPGCQQAQAIFLQHTAVPEFQESVWSCLGAELRSSCLSNRHSYVLSHPPEENAK